MKIRKATIVVLLLLGLFITPVNAAILEVGNNKSYQRVEQAAAVALPGDTILIYPGIYSGGDIIKNLHGKSEAWITILAKKDKEVIFRGGAEALHFANISFIKIEGLTFEQQTGNGVNIDDGGDAANPSHHIRFERCYWRNMNAKGNNDQLKLSGVDDFSIRQCLFLNGSIKGSLIDMVGCHRGVVEESFFENGGDNGVQAKGGSSDIIIQRNKFINAGQRAVNIGGSTGKPFYRPASVNYEAKNIRVQSNIFIGSLCAVAFVGAVNCAADNNTIYQPVRWVLRILQETKTAGFVSCSNNRFSNNIAVCGPEVKDAVNIGAGTAPETFFFTHNLWYKPADKSWLGPQLHGQSKNSLLQQDPLFIDTTFFRPAASSPAKQAGHSDSSLPQVDYYGKTFATPRSVGAVEP